MEKSTDPHGSLLGVETGSSVKVWDRTGFIATEVGGGAENTSARSRNPLVAGLDSEGDDTISPQSSSSSWLFKGFVTVKGGGGIGADGFIWVSATRG